MSLNKIDAAFAASELSNAGYTCHLRSADGNMRIYSCVGSYAAVRVWAEGDEIKCRVFTMLPKSIMKVEVGDLAFPHPNLLNFISQVDAVHILWLHSEWNQV